MQGRTWTGSRWSVLSGLGSGVGPIPSTGVLTVDPSERTSDPSLPYQHREKKTREETSAEGVDYTSRMIHGPRGQSYPSVVPW